MAQRLTEAYEKGYADGVRMAEQMTWQGTPIGSLLKDSGYRPDRDRRAAYKEGFKQALEEVASVEAMSWRERRGLAKGRDLPTFPGGALQSGEKTLRYHNLLSQTSGSGVAVRPRAEAILDNVVWLISQLDDKGLKEGQDLPFLEMAKAASVLRPLQARPSSSTGWLHNEQTAIPHRGSCQ